MLRPKLILTTQKYYPLHFALLSISNTKFKFKYKLQVVTQNDRIEIAYVCFIVLSVFILIYWDYLNSAIEIWDMNCT